MFTDILIVLSCCSITFGQNDGTSSSYQVTAFGDKIFLPEIVPLRVQRNLAENGDLDMRIDLLYSEDSIISWVAHGSASSYIDRVYLRVTDTVPSEYALQILIPRDVIQRDNSSVEDDSGGGTYGEVFKFEEGDFLVGFNELYIKFQTTTVAEAAVLKISIDADVAIDDSEVKNVDGSDEYVADEAVPQFPEMMVLDKETFVVTPGEHTAVLVDVLFTEDDRYSVRGLLYNSSSNRIFTTIWSTDYFLGQSDFQKIYIDDSSENFDDKVELLDNSGSEESPNIRQVLINIPTENDDISGVYTITGHHESNIGDPGFIVESSLEQEFVVQRESQEHGPLPPGVLEFEGGTYSQIHCRIGPKCLVMCHVYGVGVQSLDLMHKNAKSEFLKLSEEHVDLGPFESGVTAVVDSTNPAKSGTYICKAGSGPISISKEIDVTFVE